MTRMAFFVATAATFLFFTSVAHAHFGMVIPSDTMIMPNDDRTVRVTMSFSHPFELVGMPLDKPERFCVLNPDNSRTELNGALTKTKVMGQTAWQVDYKIKRPGTYVFYMEPQPYWEPAEDCFIVHHTKAVVTAFGDDEGWDKEMGLKTEILPLSKPFGLYAGNVFQGIVKLNGKPVPGAVVEVEYFNEDKKAHAPTDYMVAQTVKTDPNGVFTFSVPEAGWWGFAALTTADYTITREGQAKEVELGAVLWVKFHRWQ